MNIYTILEPPPPPPPPKVKEVQITMSGWEATDLYKLLKEFKGLSYAAVCQRLGVAKLGTMGLEGTISQLLTLLEGAGLGEE